MKTAGTTDELRRWAECWKLAGELLEEIKRNDLANLDEAWSQPFHSFAFFR